MNTKRIILSAFLGVALLVPSLARGDGAAPPAEVKALFDGINQLRTDPEAMPDALDKMLAAQEPKFETNEQFTTPDGNGKTRLQKLAGFKQGLQDAQKVAALLWDPALASVAEKEGKSNNPIFTPDLTLTGAGTPPERVLMWLALDGAYSDLHDLRRAGLKHIGIAKKAGSGDDYVIVASVMSGKAFTMTEADFAGRPYDPREDSNPPYSDALNLKQPNITPFAKADGSLDVAWRDMGNPPRVFLTRYSPDGAKVWAKQVPGIEAADYPLLAGFTEDPEGNFYILRARDEGNLDSSQEPAVPLVDGKPDPKFDRPEMMKLTKLDPSGNEVWTKPLAKTGDPGGDAMVSPLSPGSLLSTKGRLPGRDHHASTSRIGFITIKLPGGTEETPIIFALFGGATEWDSGISGRHQNCYWRTLDARTGEPVPGRHGRGMAHSFDSQLLVSDEGIITAERSDGGILMSNYLHTRDYPLIFLYFYGTTCQGNDCFTQVGSLAPAKDGYLILLAGNHSTAIVTTSVENDAFIAERARSRDLMVMRIKKGFAQAIDSIKDEAALAVVLDSKKRAPEMDEQVLMGRRYITNYVDEGKHSASRPKMVRLADGAYIVIWERWTRVMAEDKREVDGKFDSTWAMKIDQEGNVLKPEVKLPDGVRISRGDEPVVWNGRAAFLAGDVVENAMLIHTVDGELNYKVMALPAQ